MVVNVIKITWNNEVTGSFEIYFYVSTIYDMWEALDEYEKKRGRPGDNPYNSNVKYEFYGQYDNGSPYKDGMFGTVELEVQTGIDQCKFRGYKVDM